MKLHISPTLSLPLDFVTSTQVILAQKGKGKSYTAAVEAEELLDAKQQIVIVDPTGAHWGLRSSPDGKSSGYSIAVFGGEHGDVPLESTAGEVVAEAVATEHFSAILDMSLFRKGEALRFMAAFLETLYRKNRSPLHLFVDEADSYCPQKMFGPEQARCLGAAEDIVRRGRIRGIGCTLITQRPQVLNKDVLTQADMLTTLGMNHPKDLGAIEAWVAVHGDPAKAKTMIGSLPSLPKGDAWVWNPSIDLFKRVTIRERRTFDSGRTPKSGERKVEAKVLASVDIARLGADIAATVERQKANDPKALKARVVELEKQLAKKGGPVAQKIVDHVIEKPVVSKAMVVSLERSLGKVEKATATGATLADRAGTMMAKAAELMAASGLRIEAELGKLRQAFEAAQRNSSGNRSVRTGVTSDAKSAPRVPDGRPALTRQVSAKPTAKPRPEQVEAVSAAGLKPAHLRLLSAIAWWESVGVDEPDLTGVAFVAGTSTKSSAFDNNRSRLRSGGFIEYPSAGRVKMTDAGHAIAPPPSIPPTNEAIQDAVMRMVKPAMGRMLTVLIRQYPNEVSLDDFAKESGTSTTSSAFDNNRSWLRARGLAEYPRTGFVRASSLLFPEGA